MGPVDLTVADGSYGVLLGPSGAGKSLVLEAVAGVLPAVGGEVRLAGADVGELAPERTPTWASCSRTGASPFRRI